ncbi:MAG: glycosyltransferase family 4 protein [Solirubrobacteraceae bacterium]
MTGPAIRDLFVTTHTPAVGSGHSVRSYGIVRALAQHRPVDLLYVRFDASEPHPAYRGIEGLALHEVVPSRGPRRLAAYAGARVRRVPSWVARGVKPELAAAAARLAAAPERGRVIADGPAAFATLAPLARQRAVIYNAHNLESAFRHQLTSRGAREQKLLRAFERRVLETAAESWMVSDADLEGARELYPDAPLRYVPNVVDAAAIDPVPPAAGRRNALFVATFTYPPNQRALRFLVEEVMPRVWEQLPDATLTVAGVGLTAPPSADERVRALGFVEDLEALYAQASCAVVPLLEGGGTPLKLVEALAHGLPVVATRRAAAGLAVRDGEDCLIADGGESFAKALAAVLRDGAPELARRGRELALERYSIEELGRLLSEG